MLKLKKSHKNKDEWIVYNPHNFKLHTHCYSKRVALVIKSNVEKQRIPKSNNIQMIISHIRCTNNRKYKKELLNKLQTLEKEKGYKYYK